MILARPAPFAGSRTRPFLSEEGACCRVMARSDEERAAPVSPTMLLFRWAYNDPLPRVIIDDLRRLHWTNSAANAELASSQTFADQNGRLVIKTLGQSDAFKQFMEGADMTPSCFCVPAADGNGHMIISCQELAASNRTRYFGLLFRRAGRKEQIRCAALDQAFGLTRAEIRTLTSLLDGSTAEEISHDHGTTVATVRSHIKSIYSKLEVRSREALFHKARPFILDA
ncbi:helix-turn-helix transcriptional regulator [Sphingosinicella humi]|uniref:HTH luxR-type domain-containing protein n=1 Tax=Allosphingosinicella humi TaxID=2068657 RepID=A0A2U2J585_9SPHN|nr:helix-turn-helix transcriptional regulator [Sphingosinicella humi]PWG03506.1 hypothetical protein DF286_11960 [Sphingosinicella humi]